VHFNNSSVMMILKGIHVTKKKIQLVVIFIGLIGSGSVYAQPDAPVNSERYEYDYPELSVVPRASDRLKLEAGKEHDRKFINFLPVQISALSTLVSGISALTPSNSGPGAVGIGVGLGWLVTTAALSFTQSPYSSGNQRISSMPKSTIREQLTRERIAEEEIQSAADLGNKVKWLSWATNFAASAYMVTQFKAAPFLDLSGNPAPAQSDFTRAAEYASLALAFVPLFFKFHWNEVYETQTDYKKRIYAPVATATFFQDPVSHRLTSGMAVKFSF
jgi:hypothetical protein